MKNIVEKTMEILTLAAEEYGADIHWFTIAAFLGAIVYIIGMLLRIMTQIKHMYETKKLINKLELEIQKNTAPGFKMKLQRISDVILQGQEKKVRNIIILSRILEIVLEEKENVEKESYLSKKQRSIVEEIYYKNIEKYNRASIIIYMSIIIYYCINIFFSNNIKIEVVILLYVFWALTLILRFLIGYRVKRGYYGTNYGESKEILYYLAENRDKNDKNSGKKIFNEIDVPDNAGAKIPAKGELQY